MPSIQNIIRAVVAPELARPLQPVYLIRAEHAPLELAGSPHWVAWTSAYADVIYQRHLELTDRWAGRGMAIVFSERYYLLDHNEQMGVLAHEIGHWATYNPVERERPVAALQAQQIRRDHVALTTEVRRAAGHVLPPLIAPTPVDLRCNADGQHGPEFCRAAFHAAFRLALTGCRPDPVWLLGCTALSFEQAELYCSIEATDRFTESLTSVAQSPLPHGFAELARA